ncbi:DUF4034 domain-containing protein [Deinococcus pimensis]|uniref:DUF4034 domain-containing protein n=1 Tax=Deinococcus pimensis TaxID=309888 RepID=UPI00048711A8|nr:DUF4034 domain-containing protein [Deinococcus pimensis]
MTNVFPAATTAFPVLERHELLERMRADGPDWTETYFQQVQRRYEDGSLPEKDYLHAYRLAGGYREDVAPLVTAWVETHPRSAPARIFEAQHAFAHARWLRTQRLSKDVPPERRAPLAAALERAWTAGEAALDLTAMPLLAFVSMMGVRTFQGDRAWDLYEVGLERLPRSLRLRRAMLANLRAEWGGSLQDLRAFVERPEHALLSLYEQAELRANMHVRVAHHLNDFQNDREGALREAEAAVRLVRDASTLAQLAALHDDEHGAALLDEAIRLAPDDDELRVQFGVRYLMDRPRAAQRALREAAAWGQPAAHDVLHKPTLFYRVVVALSMLVTIFSRA